MEDVKVALSVVVSIKTSVLEERIHLRAGDSSEILFDDYRNVKVIASTLRDMADKMEAGLFLTFLKDLDHMAGLQNQGK